jgi:hypothetical protein
MENIFMYSLFFYFFQFSIDHFLVFRNKLHFQPFYFFNKKTGRVIIAFGSLI